MKRVTIILSAIALLFTGCNLDYAPENTMVDQTVYRDENTSEAALYGAYVRLNDFLSGAPSGSNNYPSSYHAFMFGDTGTDNIKAQSGNSDYLAIETSEYTTTHHEGFLYSIYLHGYNAIDYANNIIAGIPRYAVYSQEKQNQFVAEAKFIRAYTYFQLLLIFGDQALLGNDSGNGLIMRLTPYEGYNPDDVSRRATNSEVWAQIISDLEDNLEYLPVEVPTVTLRVRANQAAAKALLSRVYLYKGTYTNNTEELNRAAQYANEVLNTSGYTFTENETAYETLFPLNLSEESDASSSETSVRSDEIIFFEASRLDTDWYPSGIYAYYEKRSFYVPDAMKSYYEENDVRGYNNNATDNTEAYLLFQGSTSSYTDMITSKKYSNGTSSSYSDNTRGNNDVIYIRLAEMKLTRAEALTRIGNAVPAEAVQLLNDVHQRAFVEENRPVPYQISDFSSADELIRAILTERNRELAYENHHRWDLVRTDNMLNDQTLAAVAKNRWNAPIPQHEVRISDGTIEQNSGYPE